jgi:Zn-dependent protease
MPLGPFFLISLFYIILGLRVVFQLVTNWKQTWDDKFTPADRSLVTQAAFFVLLPIGVALHELGHAVAIWAMGGTVVGWGYYGFAGYVSFYPWQFTNEQLILIAAAGTLVNIVLAAAAAAFVFLRRPPARAAINELLIQFIWISLLNALVVYPLLDIVSGMNADWSQMYFGGSPALSLVILVIHAGILGLLFWAWKNPGMQARIAKLTGAPPGMRRISTGGRRPARTGRPGPNGAVNPVEAVLVDVADRVVSGWPVPVEASLQDRPGSTLLFLAWQSDDVQRGVVVLAQAVGGYEVRGVVHRPGEEPDVRGITRSPKLVNADDLTITVRLAMEAVEEWRPAVPATP